MPEQTITATATPEAATAKDVSGQRRLGRNVAFAWGGYLVNIVAGFVMPRLISDRLGQSTLGIWDFCWSVVSYFGLVQMGIGGSVNRYVAKYRARDDMDGLSRSVSTIGLSLKISAVLAGLLTVVAAMWIVPLFHQKLGAETRMAQQVVFYLGMEVAALLGLTIYGAIIVGCHRWDIHNLTSAASYFLMLVGMVTAILCGGGLPALAFIHAVCMIAAELARWRVARKVCPEFVMDFRLADWKTWKEQARYSVKSLIPRVADLISNQSLALLLTGFLGPKMLAIYSRPRNLMRQGQTIAAKFGSILVPTASSLEAQSDQGRLRETFLSSALFISTLTMPGVALVACFGDYMIQLWMGRAYVYPGLVTILAIGCFPSLIQEPVWSILSGMNRHGRLALWKLAAAACSAICLGIGLALFHWTLLGAALCFAVPQFIIDSAVAPAIGCRLVGIEPARYYANVYLKPLPPALGFVALAEGALLLSRKQPVMAALLGALAAAALGAIYLRAFSGLRSRAKAAH